MDLLLISMILAGVKMVTGYELEPKTIGHTDGSISAVKRYLKLGEWLFKSVCNKAVNSRSFKRVDWKEMTQSFGENFLGSTKRMMDDFQKTFDAASNLNRKVEELN